LVRLGDGFSPGITEPPGVSDDGHHPAAKFVWKKPSEGKMLARGRI